MAKDAKGHGSDERGGTKPSAKGMRLIQTHVLGPHSAKVYNNPEWGEKVVQTFRNGVYQSKNDYHTNDLADAHGTAMSQLNRWQSQDGGNTVAAAALASGPKSAAVPVHDSMADRQARYASIPGTKEGERDPFSVGFENGRQQSQNRKRSYP